MGLQKCNFLPCQVVMTKTLLRYKPEYKRVILEYEVAVTELDPKALDSNFGNYSLSGIEIMLQRSVQSNYFFLEPIPMHCTVQSNSFK